MTDTNKPASNDSELHDEYEAEDIKAAKEEKKAREFLLKQTDKS